MSRALNDSDSRDENCSVVIMQQEETNLEISRSEIMGNFRQTCRFSNTIHTNEHDGVGTSFITRFSYAVQNIDLSFGSYNS